MSAAPFRQTFLPHGVDLASIYLGENDSGESKLGMLQKESCGFEYSGKYLVMFSDERSYFPDRRYEDKNFDPERFIKAVVLSYDEEKQGLNSSLIKIRVNYPSPREGWHLGEIEYDVSSTDWFILDYFGDGVPRLSIAKQITIYHGCLKPYLGTSKTIEIDSQTANTVKLTYSNPTGSFQLAQSLIIRFFGEKNTMKVICRTV